MGTCTAELMLLAMLQSMSQGEGGLSNSCALMNPDVALCVAIPCVACVVAFVVELARRVRFSRGQQALAQALKTGAARGSTSQSNSGGGSSPEGPRLSG